MDVNGYIERKTMLYKTKVEYGDYTMNHVLGCAHGCRYPCYAYLMAKRFGKVTNYSEWVQPRLVKNTLELLKTEVPRLKQQIRSVQLCFTTDPFMYNYEEVVNLSLAAIEYLNNEGLKCRVLTKGELPGSLAGFSKENEYGITLISLDENYRELIEPGAAAYADRIKALQYLSKSGCKTWVSIEPYPTPNLINQSLSTLLDTVAFADKIIFGRTNYNSDVSAYQGREAFYMSCVSEVKEFCDKNKIECYIKAKTLRSTTDNLK